MCEAATQLRRMTGMAFGRIHSECLGFVVFSDWRRGWMIVILCTVHCKSLGN